MLVRIEPKYKKCVSEIEYFQNKEHVIAQFETLWRWGTFYANLDEQDLEDLIEQSKEDNFQMQTEISALPDWEFEETWDGISCDVSFSGASSVYQEKLEEEIEDMDYDYFQWFEENEFEQTGELEVWIVGPLVLEVVG